MTRIQEALNNARQQAPDQLPAYQENYKKALNLFTAIQAGRFAFEAETCFDTASILEGKTPLLPRELLLRAKDKDGQPIPPFPAIQAFKELGLGRELDMLLVQAMIIFASKKQLFPISINITSSAVPRSEFWDLLLQQLGQILGQEANQKVMFEIEANTLSSPRTHEAVLEVKKAGFKFTIDDFDPSDLGDDARANFMEIADAVKFKGSTIQAGLKGNIDLKEIAETTRRMKPDVQLIGKWVESPNDAVKLHESFGISGAQGRNLPNNIEAFRVAIGHD